MKISTRLTMVALVPALMAAAMVSVLLATYNSVSRLESDQAAAIRLDQGLGDLSDVSRSYLLTHGDRARRQYLAKHDQVVRTINEMIGRDPEDASELRRIRQDVELMEALFQKLVQVGEDPVGDAASAEAEQRLAGQLFIRARDAKTAASQLGTSIGSRIASRQSAFNTVATALTLLWAVVLTVWALGLMRTINISLVALRRGTEAVGAGDLSYRIRLRSRDELGDLGRSFDAMTERLETVTVSKAELEQEVEERRRAQEEARIELETSMLLLAAVEQLNSRPELEDVVATLAEVAAVSTDHRRALVCLLHGDRIQLAAGYGVGTPRIGETIRVSRLTSSLLSLLDGGGALVVECGEEAEVWPGLENCRSAYVVAIASRDRVLGFISLDDPGRPVDLTTRDASLAHGLASQGAISIENSRLMRYERLSATASSVLADVSAILASTKDLDADLEQVLALTGSVTDAIGGVYAERVEGGWRTIAQHHAPHVHVGDFYTDEDSPGRMAAIRQGSPYLVHDVREEAGYPHHLSDTGYRSYVVVPLLLHGEPQAAVSFLFAQPRPALAEVETTFLDRLSFVLSVSIENRMLLLSEQRRRAKAEALHQVTEIAVAALDPDQLSGAVLHYLVSQQGFDMAAVWLAEEDRLNLLAEVGYPEAYRRMESLPLSGGSEAARVYETGEASIVPDAAVEPQRWRLLAEKTGMQPGAWAVLPLRSRGRTIGTFHFAWHEAHDISDEDVEFLTSLGNELGVVIENARLFQTEHDIAERLQSALLALPSTIPGVEFAHAYHSAAESARVGGDFYDLFEIDEDLIGITIGDVAGKGLNAAMLTSLVKNTIRAHSATVGTSPASVLDLTNDVVYRATPPESFVTVFLGILDRRDGRLTYANAGHTTAVMVDEHGGITRLRATGPILGAFPRLTFDQSEACCLDDTRMLFLYTDGLTEARRRSEMYGEERVFELLGSAGTIDPNEIVHRVIDDVLDFTALQLRDDMALLAIRCSPPDGSVPVQQRLDV